MFTTINQLANQPTKQYQEQFQQSEGNTLITTMAYIGLVKPARVDGESFAVFSGQIVPRDRS